MKSAPAAHPLPPPPSGWKPPSSPPLDALACELLADETPAPPLPLAAAPVCVLPPAAQAVRKATRMTAGDRRLGEIIPASVSLAAGDRPRHAARARGRSAREEHRARVGVVD